MSCQEYKELMMGYLDSELDEGQRERLEQHLVDCPECYRELEEFRKLKDITDDVSLAEPEDRLWEQYWGSVYNRVERGIGWVLFSAAGILLLIYGGFKWIEEIIRDETVGLLLKAGLLVLIAGAAVLFVSVLRERLYIRKRDRYKDVRR